MRVVFSILVVAGACLQAGCNTGSTFSLDEARTICDGETTQFGPPPFTDAVWDTFVVTLTTDRDAGVTKIDAIADANSECAQTDDPVGCNTCNVAIIDALWR